MRRTVKHVELHRIGLTELRVISDVDAGVIPIVEQEEAVLRGYQQHGPWPHTQVSLFILQDLQPLARQLRGGSLPPGGVAALDSRTVINLFDLANPRSCNLFVNRQAMLTEGYWEDLLAIRGLLAHEHAHPLAENSSTRASRALQISVELLAGGLNEEQRQRLERLLHGLLEQLCAYAPREISTNQQAIEAGFADAMLHLNQRNLANALQSLAGREQLRARLEQEVAQGQRAAADPGRLLLVGDLENTIKLAMELAPFERAGRSQLVFPLEQILQQQLFPRLEPEIAAAYTAIRQLYSTLNAHAEGPALQAWAAAVAAVIAEALSSRQLILNSRIELQTTGQAAPAQDRDG